MIALRTLDDDDPALACSPLVSAVQKTFAWMGRPGRIFDAVVPVFLFQTDHAIESRVAEERVLVHWDVVLNVLNAEADGGATGAQLWRVLYNAPAPGYDAVMTGLYVQALRPLCWAGLLRKEQGPSLYRVEEARFFKTALWKASLVLDADVSVGAATSH
jgi:hypothetical protein